MPLILAIEPDRRQATQLKAMVRARLAADLVLAESVDQGLIELGDRVPDLILTSALLSRKDEVALNQRLRALDGTASFVQTLTIPVFATAPEKKKRTRGLLSALRREAPVSKSTTHGCDPAVFAEQCAEYLERAQAERVRQAEEEAARAFATPAAEPAPFVLDATPPGFEELPRDAEPVSYETFAPLPETWRTTPVDEFAFRTSTDEAAWHAVTPEATYEAPPTLEVTAENALSYTEEPPAAPVIPIDAVIRVIPVMTADPVVSVMPVIDDTDTVLLISPVVEAPQAPPAEPEPHATALVPEEAETSPDVWLSLAATQDTITAAAIVPVILEIPGVEDTVVVTSPVVESPLETLPPEPESPAASPFADEAPPSVDEALSIAASAEAVDVQPVAPAFEADTADAADAPRDEPAIAAHEQEFEPALQRPEGEPIFAMPVVVEEPSADLPTLEVAAVSLPAVVEVEEPREPSIETPVETVPAVPVRERSVPWQLGVRQLWPPLEGVPVDEVDEVDEVAFEEVGDALHADSVELDLTGVTEEASPAVDEFELLMTSPAIDDLIEAMAALDAQDTLASGSSDQAAAPDDSLLDAHLLEPFEDWTADGLTFENDRDADVNLIDLNVADVNLIDVNVTDDVNLNVVSMTGSADAAGEPEESVAALDATEPETAEAQVIAEVALDAAASVDELEPVLETPAAPESAVEAKAIEPRTDRHWTSVADSDDVIDDDFEEEPFEDDPIDMETEAWAPLRIGVHQLWPRLEGGIALSREIAVIETRRPTPIVEPPPLMITASVPRIARPPVTIRRAPAIVATPIVVPPIAPATFEPTTPVMASEETTSAGPAEPVMRQEPIVEAHVDVTEAPRELRETAIATPPAAIVVPAPENERSAMTVTPPETVETGASPVFVAATAPAPVVVTSPTPVSVIPPTPIAVSAPLTPIAITELPSLVSEAPPALMPLPAVEAARPEWLDVIESLKRDVERLQSDRVQPTAPPAQVPPVEVQVHVQAPAAPTASKHVAPAEQKPMDASGKKRRSRKKKKKGVQEDWGFFDPEQVGFSALLSKLDEVTNDGPKRAG